MFCSFHYNFKEKKMEISRNALYTLLCFGAGFFFSVPQVFPRGYFKFLLVDFFAKPLKKETIKGMQEEAKELLDLAQKGDTHSQLVIQDALVNKQSRLHGVFCENTRKKKTVLAADPSSRPAPLVQIKNRDGTILWKPSKPASLD